MEHARPATRDDIPRLVALARELREELTAYRGGSLWATHTVVGEPLERHFEALCADADARLIVGEIDAVVVGYGTVSIESLRDGTRLGVVSELFVEPGARSVGVGEAITNTIVDHCRAHGCRGVDVVALPGHRATKNFFEEQGFTARAIVMHHELDDGPAPLRDATEAAPGS